MGRGIFKDDKAATVIFGTLLIILVTITLVSGLAFVASLTMKQNAERQAVLDASKNENLKIVTIKPTASSDPSYWDSLNVTVLNLDILDAEIATISINGKYLLNYYLLNETGKPICIKGTSYPEIYNYSHKAEIPAGESRQIYIGSIHTSESITPTAWTVNLNNCPSKVYSGDYNRNVIIRDSTNIFTEGSSNFTLDDIVSALNINPSSGINIGNTYTVEYTTFLNGNMEPTDVLKTDSITAEILSDRTNIFSRRFMPPEPIADVKIEPAAVTGTNYLLLDASNSNAPDGYLTSYKWYVNKTGSGYFDKLSGIKVRTSDLNTTDYPVEIDLEITNNYGMVSKLSDPGRAGNITVT